MLKRGSFYLVEEDNNLVGKYTKGAGHFFW